MRFTIIGFEFKMVNLTNTNEQAAFTMGEGSSSRAPLTPRNHHNWRKLMVKEPTTLRELEKLAKKAAKLMKKYGGTSDENVVVAMDLLRLEYNMV